MDRIVHQSDLRSGQHLKVKLGPFPNAIPYHQIRVSPTLNKVEWSADDKKIENGRMIRMLDIHNRGDNNVLVQVVMCEKK